MRIFRILRVVWWVVTAESRRRARQENYIPLRPDPSSVDWEVAETFEFGTWSKEAQDYAQRLQEDSADLARIWRAGQKAFSLHQRRMEAQQRRMRRRELYSQFRVFLLRLVS